MSFDYFKTGYEFIYGDYYTGKMKPIQDIMNQVTSGRNFLLQFLIQ